MKDIFASSFDTESNHADILIDDSANGNNKTDQEKVSSAALAEHDAGGETSKPAKRKPKSK